ncbi:hypothetical protein G7K_1511-t1 [Saitoella complicata NRRL Y-17804]|uniref:Uncharacterized protein n=1 Tax=Saitoella complicata (strain BCRC 22490 / CBS 7301 / JCM 7358 / NBRC 10748 / NRRL Y-17804) TaxID=698492 RepID=A0A0E9NBQ0_SAICN|nr:hypothetical protein G7K_1511-t1 [Saitoella complicata NRRL Y-17804]
MFLAESVSVFLRNKCSGSPGSCHRRRSQPQSNHNDRFKRRLKGRFGALFIIVYQHSPSNRSIVHFLIPEQLA